MQNDVQTLVLLGFDENVSSFARPEKKEGPRARSSVPEGAARSVEDDRARGPSLKNQFDAIISHYEKTTAQDPPRARGD